MTNGCPPSPSPAVMLLPDFQPHCLLQENCILVQDTRTALSMLPVAWGAMFPYRLLASPAGPVHPASLPLHLHAGRCRSRSGMACWTILFSFWNGMLEHALLSLHLHWMAACRPASIESSGLPQAVYSAPSPAPAVYGTPAQQSPPPAVKGFTGSAPPTSAPSAYGPPPTPAPAVYGTPAQQSPPPAVR